jgi:hypothetical protein
MNSELKGGSRLAGWGSALTLTGVLAVAVACGGESGGPSEGSGGTGGSDSVAGQGGMGTGGDVGLGGTGQGGVPQLTGDVGSVPLHRLNNLEYNNTVRDLLGTTLRPADKFQTPELAYGFDNIAVALTMNTSRVRGFYDAAEDLAEDVFASDALRGQIVTCEPPAAGDTSCAEQVITAFGLRAFRRPLEQWEVTNFVTKYQEAQQLGLDHNGALQHVVRIMLSSPQFVYRFEIDPEPLSVTPRALNGYEVASRLSYLMWSSMPDTELFSVAGDGQILQDDVLRAQVDRMLTDPKSSMLVESFAAQWFGSVRLAKHTADTMYYPDWNDSLKASMQGELNAFFDEFLHGDRAFSEYLTADVNYIDANLAALYGMPAPAAPGLNRIEFTTDERRGFLGLAGFLTHTSRGNRTAPTIRAKWVLSALQCKDIEPPANIVIQPLPEVDPTTADLTVRQQIELHAQSEVCSACHAKIDPIGLALEYYDPIGKYRTQYLNGDPIDANAVLPNNSGDIPLNGLTSLATALSSDSQLLDCAAKKLFIYGLGRPIEQSGSYLTQVSDQWQAEGSVLRNLIKQLVVNDVFRYRHGTPD